MKKSAELAIRFLVDILIGIIGFVLVGCAALLLGIFVSWLKSHNIVDGWIISAMILLEYATFLADIIGYMFLILMSLVKFLREVWKEYKA